MIYVVSSEETPTNELSLTQSTADLDVNLKKALLKALAELENEERTNKNNSDTKIIKDDRVFEKASASAVNFIASPSPTSTTSTTPIPISTSSQNPVIVQKSDSVQQHTVFSFEPLIRDDKEQIQTSASSSFLQNDITIGKETSKTKNSINVISTTTTTTTAAPPSSTEENEAKVEDVQFFSAPLVAAFTVHQDERGLPRSVVPIFKQNDNIHTNSSPNNQNVVQNLPTLTANKLQSDLYLNYQEQQKALSEQISKLQKQQQFYNEYLSRQQALFPTPSPTPSVVEQTIPVTQNQQFFTTTLNGNSIAPQNTVLVQPSYSFSPQHIPLTTTTTTTTFPPPFPTAGQQLPIKNAVDFNKNSYFLPLRYNTLLQPPAPELNPFHVPTVTPLPSHTRIFRQELHTGNFLNAPFTHQNRFPFHAYQQFRGNYHNVATSPFLIQPPVVNQRLNDLLYRSGIGFGKQQEDLSIVSKVLALNRLRRNSYVNSRKTLSTSVSE